MGRGSHYWPSSFYSLHWDESNNCKEIETFKPFHIGFELQPVAGFGILGFKRLQHCMSWSSTHQLLSDSDGARGKWTPLGFQLSTVHSDSSWSKMVNSLIHILVLRSSCIFFYIYNPKPQDVCKICVNLCLFSIQTFARQTFSFSEYLARCLVKTWPHPASNTSHQTSAYSVLESEFWVTVFQIKSLWFRDRC